MSERTCEHGCTSECYAIWEARVQEIEAAVARRVAKVRKDRVRRMREDADMARGGLRHIGSVLSDFEIGGGRG